SVLTLEGFVEKVQIRLNADIRLPEKKRVYIVIPDFETKHVSHIFSPRLAHPEDAADFKKAIVEVISDADV
ncbi:MAG: hypothetical protein ACE5I1_15335, partial [bacterium]